MRLAAKRYSLPFLMVVFVTSAAPYDHPLESSAIRDAYFLGTDNYRSAEFLSTYLKKLPVPKSGPYVSEIAVRTPFAQVVAGSHDHSIGYSAQQAEQEYRESPNTVLVRVQIFLTPPLAVSNVAQPPAACQGFQRMSSALACFDNFRFHFLQQNRSKNKNKSIQPQSSYGVPIYLGDGGAFSGGDVWFIFRASQIASAPLHVSVTRPDGNKFSADFDLTTLR